MLLGICSFPICEAPHGGSTQVVRPGHTVAWGLQSQLLLAPSQLATTSPTTGKVVFAFCLSSDNIVPYGPSASICCGFSQRRQQPKNLPWVTLKSGSCKIKQCPIVLHSPNPSHFHKAFRQYWGGGGGEGEKKKLWGNSWLDSGKADQTSASNKRHLHISHLFFIIYRSNLPKFSKGE